MAVAPDSPQLDPSGRLVIRPSLVHTKRAVVAATISAVGGAALAVVRPLTFSVLGLLGE